MRNLIRAFSLWWRGRKLGVIEDYDFTFGSAGHQWTQISGKRYATWWNHFTKDWKSGDTVTFSVREVKGIASLHGELEAYDIRKEDPMTTHQTERGEG